MYLPSLINANVAADSGGVLHLETRVLRGTDPKGTCAAACGEGKVRNTGAANRAAEAGAADAALERLPSWKPRGG